MSTSPQIVTESSPQAKGITVHVFTGAAGALAFAGHSLRIDVSKYIVEYFGVFGKGAAALAARASGSAAVAAAEAHADHSSDLRLVKFTCPADGLSTLSRINKGTKEDVGPLKASDKTAIDERMKGKNVLDAANFPEVVFVPKTGFSSLRSCLPLARSTEESSGTEASRAVEGEFVGDLTLKGVTREIRCTTKLVPGVVHPATGVMREDMLVINCPIYQTAFGIKPFSILGMLAVADLVEVEVRIPTHLL